MKTRYVVVATGSDLAIAVYGSFPSERAAERWAKARRTRTYAGQTYDWLVCPIFEAHQHPALARIAVDLAADRGATS